ncbi:endonuclease/exonuclease/phosphatase family protein [Alienimonas chondri]|uniref:Endonuclease/exonuclease/phosphatase domain-containing protein n=1 Tax=Alienimonas chondri TaxID=2681879 RepID=A0ABX1VFN2_9PLAN|nr:endonuclease/exonuclease/phosphatase family protein [Alienimonas chondri]NNJ26078.1 hypothetical protein [Alienimonas chondri]
MLRRLFVRYVAAWALLGVAGAAEPEGLRVATYNIKHGAGNDGTVDLARTAAVPAKLRPDVVGLQEVDEHALRSGSVDQARDLAKRLKMHAAFGPFMDFQGGRYGLAILSKFPIESSRVVKLPAGGEPRVALMVEVRPPGAAAEAPPVTIVNVHFDWLSDDRDRFRQATTLKKELDALPGPYLLLGDFNDTPGSRTLELLSRGCLEAKKPADDRFTFSAVKPSTEIDYIFAAPADGWSVEGARVIDERVASDHRPVFATFRPLRDAPASGARK